MPRRRCASSRVSRSRPKVEQACVAAIKELLDRGYGKSVQAVDGDGAGGAINHTIEFVSAKETLVRKLVDLSSRMTAAAIEKDDA